MFREEERSSRAAACFARFTNVRLMAPKVSSALWSLGQNASASYSAFHTLSQRAQKTVREWGFVARDKPVNPSRSNAILSQLKADRGL